MERQARAVRCDAQRKHGGIGVSCTGPGAELDDPCGSLPSQHILWFCDTLWEWSQNSLPKIVLNHIFKSCFLEVTRSLGEIWENSNLDVIPM